MAGPPVTRFESVYPALTRVADDHPIVGRTIESISARGKHLLIQSKKTGPDARVTYWCSTCQPPPAAAGVESR